MGSSAPKLAGLSFPGITFAQLGVRDLSVVNSFVAGLPRPDVLLNAAGFAPFGTEFDEDTFADVLDVT
ncbi:MAG: hypothetical protein H7245_11350 [Candidatus Saccharibacteria bacterium]|nr:hypothetical protein [Pseudorhodobacter sp.]